MTTATQVDRSEAWRSLSASAGPPDRFDPDGSSELPTAAQRFLLGAIEPGAELPSAVLLAMEGEIKLGRWRPFRARQVLNPRAGFVWEATVGRRVLRFSGGDWYCRGYGALDFRLWGVLPVARASGPDVARSAAGRLAAETVAWAPQALTSGTARSWRHVDEERAVVTVPAGTETVDVLIQIDERGALAELALERWGNPGGGAFASHPFGGRVDAHLELDGVRIAQAGRVGWWWGTGRQAEGEFFRYEVTSATPAA